MNKIPMVSAEEHRAKMAQKDAQIAELTRERDLLAGAMCGFRGPFAAIPKKGEGTSMKESGCPNCSTPFNVTDPNGTYKCPKCGITLYARAGKFYPAPDAE